MFNEQNPFMVSRLMFFGPGMSKITGDKLKSLGCKKVYVVFDKGIEKLGIPKRIVENINAAGVETVEYSGVVADPPSHIVDEAAEIGKRAGVDGVVALGGGSPIDTAKAVRVLLSNDGPLKVERYIFDNSPQVQPEMPLVIIPTTAGTGSEATEGAMISHIDEQGEHWKKILECTSNKTKDMSIIDPQLALGTPQSISMGCAFDTLTHAMESCMSKFTSPLIQANSKTAIRLFVNSCKKIYQNINDLDARTDMALACTLAGISINCGYVNCGHAFGHALGSVFGVHHGIACGVFAPAVLEFYAEAMPAEVTAIAEIFGIVPESGEEIKQLAERFARTLNAFAVEVGVDVKGIVATKEECYRIIPQVMADYSWHLGLRELDEEGGKWIIDRTYGY